MNLHITSLQLKQLSCQKVSILLMLATQFSNKNSFLLLKHQLGYIKIRSKLNSQISENAKTWSSEISSISDRVILDADNSNGTVSAASYEFFSERNVVILNGSFTPLRKSNEKSDP